MKTELSLALIINYLKKLYSDFNQYRLPDNIKINIEEFLYQGKIGEAKTALESYIEENKNSKQAIEAELMQLMEEMKKNPAFNEKIEPKLEYQSSFSCVLCNGLILNSDLTILEDCPHMFHKNCISKNIEQQMLADSEMITCPLKECKAEIQFHYLELYVSNEMIKNYQENSMQRFIKSGKFGKIIECPNTKCKIQFSVDEGTGYCPECNSAICGKCFTLLDNCTCNPIIMKRQCPQCNIWIDKSRDRYTRCNSCSIFFCFECLNKPAVCKCKKP